MELTIITDQLWEELIKMDRSDFKVKIKDFSIPNKYIDRMIVEADKRGLFILGGDILEIVNGNLIHTYDNWYSDIKDQENQEDYRIRTYTDAQNFLKNYKFKENNFIVFVLR